MRKFLNILSIACLSAIYGHSQNPGPPHVPEQDYFYWQLDSLAANFHYKPLSKDLDTFYLNKRGFQPEDLPAWPDDIYAGRLRDLGSPIQLDFNYAVKAFINLYIAERREQVSRMLGLRFIYFPIFEEIFEKEGLPHEFKYLAAVESALNTHAVSRAGATGIWQFMFSTGKLYGLKIDSYVDERRDPIKATHAAAKYFKDMYRIYKDWLLVIAAYNCGPGNVNRAIRRSGGKTNFWEISPYLPAETRGYVPAFIAANYVFNYASDHNLYPVPLDFTFQTDTVVINRQQITLQQIANITGASFYELKDLNPELKTNTVPYSTNGYVLRLPHSIAMKFVENREGIYEQIAAINPDSILKTFKTDQVSPISRQPYMTQNAPEGSTFGNKVLVYHTVRSGEVVGQIATRYGVRATDVASWNNLHGYRIHPGQKLKIYSPSAAKQQQEQKEEPKVEVMVKEGQKYYKVQAGDTLWDIAKRFDGLTVDKLKELNKLSDNNLIVGQMLLVN